MQGCVTDAAATLDIYEGTLDNADEVAYAAYVAALVATIASPEPEAAVGAVETAVQAQLDTLQVCTRNQRVMCLLGYLGDKLWEDELKQLQCMRR